MAPLPVTNGQFKFFWCKQDYKSGLGRPHSIFQFSSLWWNVCGGTSPGQARQGGHNLQLIPSRNKSVQWGQCLSDLSRLISPHQLVTSVRFVTKSKSVSLPVLSCQAGRKEPEKKRKSPNQESSQVRWVKELLKPSSTHNSSGWHLTVNWDIAPLPPLNPVVLTRIFLRSWIFRDYLLFKSALSISWHVGAGWYSLLIVLVDPSY